MNFDWMRLDHRAYLYFFNRDNYLRTGMPELVFASVPGVLATRVGYTGGTTVRGTGLPQQCITRHRLGPTTT